MTFLPHLLAFSFILGSGVNLLLWWALGFRPRYGFLVNWLVAGELYVTPELGLGATVVASLVGFLMFWAMGEEHMHHMAREATDLDMLVNPAVYVLDAMGAQGALCRPSLLDKLPTDGRVVVFSFLRPLLAWHLRRRGFHMEWVTDDRVAAWPVWVRESGGGARLEVASAR